MSLVLAIDDVKPEHIRNRKPKGNGADSGGTHTEFFKAAADKPDDPTAFIIQYAPGGSSNAHYHALDEFQIVISGEGTIGRHQLSPYTLHFARAYTPYGPLRSKGGWAFLTLRVGSDRGSQHDYQKLKQIPDRQPWQVTTKVEFPRIGADPVLKPISEIKDERGLFADVLTVPPHAQIVAPDPAGGGGQYVVPLKGSLMHDGREHKALAVVFVKPGEEPFHIQAGAQGLEALVLNFPARRAASGAVA